MHARRVSRRPVLRMALAVAALLSTLGAGAAVAAACETSYLNGMPPALVGTQTDRTKELCFTYFAVLHSEDKLEPLWSAAHLTRAAALGGDAIPRKDAFEPEDALLPGPRAELADYKGYKGIYDRGHMTPADDMPDFPSQKETFTLANMVPQASRLNQGTWQYIEASLHVLAEQDGELYIVTGPIFSAHPKRLHGRVAVPDYTFKAVFDVKSGRAIGFVATNVNTPQCWEVSVARLTVMSGVDPFPSLPASSKADGTPWDLPNGTNGRPKPDCAPPP